MKFKGGTCNWMSVVALLTFLVGSSAIPSRLSAQDYPLTTKGESAIWKSTTANINSLAVVDAKPFYSNDICSAINFILTDSSEFKCGGTNPKGVVVDARGITSSGGTLTCSVNPFDGSNGKCSNGSFLDGEKLTAIVLLPAATIRVQQPWVLPSNAKVIGEGKSLTTLQACTAANCGAAFAGDILQMGSSAICGTGNDCQGVGIEHLTLDAQNIASVNGIHNVSGQELGYVKDVAISNIHNAVGLLVESNGGNSGPYSDISFFSNSSGATCAQLKGSTRGVHGLTCNGGTGSTTTAVALNGPDNSVEDVYITGGYTNGILVGAGAQSNLLFNIHGDSGVSSVITISSNTSGLSDLSIMGVTGPGGSVATITDNLTGGPVLHDSSVGMYVLGEQVTGNGSAVGYSRFTTSPNVPAWFVGSGSVVGSACSTGGLYSNTSGPIGTTLSVCVDGRWQSVQ